MGTSWEDYFRECEGNPSRPVDSILFRTGGVAQAALLGKGFLIDNLTESSFDPTQLAADPAIAGLDPAVVNVPLVKARLTTGDAGVSGKLITFTTGDTAI